MIMVLSVCFSGTKTIDMKHQIKLFFFVHIDRELIFHVIGDLLNALISFGITFFDIFIQFPVVRGDLIFNIFSFQQIHDV